MFERLQQWLYMTDKQIFYVTGRTGYGKSALSATLCKCYSSDVAASHFFQKSAGPRAAVNCIASMIESLASGLCKTCPMYLSHITDQYKQDPAVFNTVLRNKNWHGLYKVLLSDPLHHLYSSGGACCGSRRRYMFVIDALDECRPNDWAPIKSFLELFVKELPSSFKIFVTTHSQHHAQLVPNQMDDIEGILLENRSWINRHIKDVEVYLARYFIINVISLGL